MQKGERRKLGQKHEEGRGTVDKKYKLKWSKKREMGGDGGWFRK